MRGKTGRGKTGRQKIALLLSCMMAFGLSGCQMTSQGGQTTAGQQESTRRESPSGTAVATAMRETPSLTDGGTASSGKRILVAYFSCTGTTKQLAGYAAEHLNADLYEIQAENPYTDDDLNYRDSDSRATREQNDPSARPEIAGQAQDMAQYGTVLIAYPIWHGQAPRIMYSFLESYDFSGKTIVPFCTSHSSPIGSSDINLHPLCPEASWEEGKRFPAGISESEMGEWLDRMGIFADTI